MKYSEEEILTLMAKKVALEFENEIDEMENNLLEVPEELDHKTQSMINEMILKDRRNKYRNSLKRVAALLIVCLSIFNMFAFTVSEAYREKVLKFVPHEEDGSVHLLHENEAELLDGWDDYWYPDYLPEGYRLVAAEKEGVTLLVFISDFDDCVIRIEQYSENAGMAFNTDGVEYRSIDINHYDGFIFVDERYDSVLLVWRTDESILQIHLSGSIDEEVAIQIAESMKLINK